MEYLAGETLYGLSKRHDVMEIYAHVHAEQDQCSNPEATNGSPV